MITTRFMLGRTHGRLSATPIRYGVMALAALAVTVASTTAAQAYTVTASPPLETNLPAPPPVKKYRLEAVKFKCIDESGWDLFGSDEPYWVFSSVGQNGTSATRHSVEFSDVDSGDVRTFAGGDGYVFPQSGTSAPAPSGIGYSIQVWDADGGSAADTVAKTGTYFKAAGAISVLTPAPAWVGEALGYVGTATSLVGQWLKDDMMGTETRAYSQADLDAHLHSVGSTFVEEHAFTDGDADYSLTLRVTRTA